MLVDAEKVSMGSFQCHAAWVVLNVLGHVVELASSRQLAVVVFGGKQATAFARGKSREVGTLILEPTDVLAYMHRQPVMHTQ